MDREIFLYMFIRQVRLNSIRKFFKCMKISFNSDSFFRILHQPTGNRDANGHVNIYFTRVGHTPQELCATLH